MQETDFGGAVANPRRTRLGSDWTAGSTGASDGQQPAPSPTPDAGATNAS
ncbi:hypothetical protein [Saccharothrix algeriensis]|uniref:Uncharacterized protein n=1 Tax=Saccharothrix algeriensis TaxID=173560 RepID=A0A8T8I172_9PSEU|nr:hypothetical protein [Saccharothrix algeriensis]MBM7810424.1 hypothetical protein [Saccharothrix algeriensis]QTR04552.1 hypothetical protein J7S33_06715 [Saccharothrix algeriensis]